MTGKPYRLPETAARGSGIDRSKQISYSFDGAKMTGFSGDTVASAVLASGRKVMGRSFKYHRPRGLIGLGSEEMNALIGVGDGGRREPNLRATQVELYDGLTAISQNSWPSLDFDIGIISNKFSRFLPGAFTTRPSCGRAASGKRCISRLSAMRPALAKRRAITTPTRTNKCMFMWMCWSSAVVSQALQRLMRLQRPANASCWQTRTRYLAEWRISPPVISTVSVRRTGLPRAGLSLRDQAIAMC